MHGIYKLQLPRNSPCSRSRMENLRPFLSVNSVPVISNLVSKLLYDIIEVTKSKILPLRLQTGRMAKKQKKLGIEFAVFPKSHAKSKTTSEV